MSWRDWIGGQSEPWRRIATDRLNEAFRYDSDDVVHKCHRHDEAGAIDGLLIGFSYRDASNNPSRRKVLCRQSWTEDGVTYIRGYCTLREALRTFRADRMRELIELRTGRRIDDAVSYFEHFAEDDAPPRGDRPPPVLSYEEIHRAAFDRQLFYRAREASMDGLRVLGYVALANDILTSEELNVETSYVESRLAIVGIEHNDDILGAMTWIARSLAVPHRSFMTALNRVAAEKAHYRLVREVADIIAACQPGPQANVQHALDAIAAAGGR